jgi:hypothetical protein
LLFPTLLLADREKPAHSPVLRGPYLGQKPPGMTPELFAPYFISTGLSEGVCTFMPDKSEMIFPVIYRKPHARKVYVSMVESRVTDGACTSPEMLSGSGTAYADAYPFISYDGRELLFQSSRPTNDPGLKDEYNIWRCRRIDGGWSTPEPLPPPINGRGSVSGPSMSLSGDFYFTLMSGRPEDGIYASRYKDGKFSEPERLPESVNVKEGSFDGVISPDGSYYIVCVYGKEDSLGGTDLYITFKDDEGHWTPLKNLGGKINTLRNEGSAMITPEGKYLFFSGCMESHDFYSDVLTYADLVNNALKPQYGNPDIYWVSAQIIDGLRPRRSHGQAAESTSREKSPGHVEADP